MTSALPILSAVETRVLGVLAEKQRTVPDSYPLTLNTLVAGCNQKTSRNPLMELSETEVQAALDSLKGYSLVMESSGGRVARYEHNIERVLRVPSQSTILLTVLMLRGPQTAAELRLNCERLHRFADVSSVEAFLDELATKEPHRVVKLARAPGEREARWAHLLCGEPAIQMQAVAMGGGETGVSSGELSALRGEVTRLAEELAALRAELAAVKGELGLN
jgi:uncharacterized protein YceH (UPF0502 family)